jgi:6-phosphogluconolactonase
MIFSPSSRRVYVANELSVDTTVFARDPATGTLTPVRTYPNIPPGWPKGTGSAEIALHPSGRWLYVSTRIEDFMTVFQVNPESAAEPLTLVQIVASPVKFPRHFAIDPTGRWIVIAGQTDNRIGVLKLDPGTGKLTPTAESAPLDRPVCVLFAPH